MLMGKNTESKNQSKYRRADMSAFSDRFKIIMYYAPIDDRSKNTVPGIQPLIGVLAVLSILLSKMMYPEIWCSLAPRQYALKDEERLKTI